MSDIEVAPIGTRKLLEEAAETFRRYEKQHRDKLPARQEIVDAKATRESVEASKLAIADITAKADANARIAGKIEAHLAGWEQ